MSFQVTTLNRGAARKLLTQCGVSVDMARTMGLKQIQEHLENFVQLGTIAGATVVTELAAQQAQSGQPANAGAPWTKQADEELMEHFRRGMALQTMASIKGRTVGGIKARLQFHGLLEYNRATGRHDLTDKGRALRESNGGDENFVPHDKEIPMIKAGDFANAAELAKMDAEHKDEQAANASPPVEESTQAGVDQVARKAIKTLENRVSTIASAVGDLNGAIADTIAAEVKKVQGAWQKFEIQTQDRTHKIEGLAHKAFPKLLRAVSARTRHDGGALNIWLYGPAGTGKSTAARKLAEAFSMDFHTNGPVGSQWDIRGFTDAQGKVVETAFRRAWINGGVYCWDEGDGSAPAALIEANGALATGFASFPDGTFQRHKDCIVIINGNLRPGAAPDATYNGRYKQDTAFVNRFVAIEWGIDEDLERALLGKLDAIGEQWVRFVRTLRSKVRQRGIKGIVISPRQLQYGLALLDAGAELDEAMEQTVKFMFTDEQWKQVAA